MRNLLKFLFKFYIEASIHVALSVSALVHIFLLQHRLSTDFNLLGTIFFGTITGYNFVKYASVARLHHRSLTKSLRLIQVFSLGCFLLLIYYGLKLPEQTLLMIFSGGFLTFLYAIPLIYRKNIRSVSGLKIYIVALSWSVITVLVPIIHFKLPVSLNLMTNFLQVFIFVIALVIPFDIRDIAYDSKQLNTLPQILGIKNSKILAILLLLLFFILEILQKKLVVIESTSFIILLTGILIWKTSLKNSWYYCSFIIEAIPIIYWLLIYLFIV